MLFVNKTYLKQETYIFVLSTMRVMYFPPRPAGESTNICVVYYNCKKTLNSYLNIMIFLNEKFSVGIK